ncbi:MAG: phosphate ABC transporter substrate-binding/OmpA family protein [Pseudomonadota bacterium]
MRIRGLSCAIAALTGITLATGAAAQDNLVTLKSFDGFTQLRGELVDFDGQRYTIQTRLGVLQIDVFLVSCEGEACPTSTLFGAEFGIHGSSTVGAALMPSLIEGYAESMEASVEDELTGDDNQRVFRIIHSSGEEMANIDFQTRGSSSAFRSLTDGSASIGMASRSIKEEEVASLGAAGLRDPRETELELAIAKDGILVIVHPDNPVRSISLNELASIYSGQITNWADLGGNDREITVYAHDDASGTRDTFDNLVLAPISEELTPNAVVLSEAAELSDRVAGDISGIGYGGLAFERTARALPLRQECGLLSYPTSFAIKSDEYPLARRLFLYGSDEQESIHAQNLMNFASSDDAAPFIEDAGYISLLPEAQTLREQGQRITHAIIAEDEFSLDLMREMLTEFRDAERLSLTFRFTPGSSQLTAQSQADAERFARDIVAGRYEGKEILLVGFTDSIGQFALNRALATRRAQGVLFTMNEAVASVAGASGFAGANISVQGYGELTPVGCNTTFAGRVANRRVEVWVR